MKYLVIIYSNPAVVDYFAAMPVDQRLNDFQVYWDVETELQESGELVDSKAVDGDAQKAVRRGTDGSPVVTAVPPAESGEVVTGYYLVDVADEARAFEIATRFPEAAVEGGIRVARGWTDEDFSAAGM